MAEGISAGEVFVDIRPNFEFGARAKKKAETEGDRAGAAYGKEFVKNASRDIQKAMAVLLRQSVIASRKAGRDAGKAFAEGFGAETKSTKTRDMPVGPSKERARRSGQESAGGFAEAFRKQLAAASKAMPPLTVGVASTAAEQQVRDLQAGLRALASKTVGVDVDAATALAEVRQINAALNDLAQSSPDVQVRVDSAAASAQLVKLDAQLAKLDRQHVAVNVDADTGAATAQIAAVGAASFGAMSGISALITAGAAIGPAIVPAAAAAAGALAAIGPAAIVGAAGIGVMALAFSGIGEAVSALNDQQIEAGKGAAKAATQQASLAGAADRVRQAKQQLTAAEREAAASSKRASRDVADAQKALTGAERDALKIRRDLTQAYQDARDAQADLASQVAANSRAQRQAVLDVADVQRDLNAAQVAYDQAAASPLTSAARLRLLGEELEQARINFETQTAQQADLGRKATQLAREQADSQRRGIAGSTQVVAARERIAEADARVASAQRALSDAQAARDEARVRGAEQIVAAQQQVVAAQRASGVAASQAAGEVTGVQKAMAALSPAGQAFARFLFTLKPLFMELKAVAEQGLFDGIRAGIEALRPMFPQIKAFIGQVAAAFGQFFAAFGKAMTDPAWQTFFATMGRLAGPLMKSAATILAGLGKGFAILMVAFAPLAEEFAAALAGMATAFAAWAAEFVKSQAFADFITYLRENGPLVGQLFLLLIKFAVRLLVAFAPFGELVLEGLVKLFDFLATVDLNVLLYIIGAVAAGIAALVAVMSGPVGLIVAAVAVAVVAFLALWTRIRAYLEPFFVWLRAAFMALWQNVIKPVWDGISAAISWAYENVIKPVLTALGWFLTNVLGPAFSWLYKNVILPVWTGIKIAISVAWALIKVVFGLITIGVKIIGAVFRWLYENAIKPAFFAIYNNVIKPVWEKYIRPVFLALGGFIKEHVVPAFKSGVTAIGKAWEKIKDVAKVPVRFVVETILNKGIIGGYNKLATMFDVKPVEEIKLPKGFATGGAIRGPGTGTSDSILARLSNDEHVWTAREVRAAGGHGAVEALRRSALSGLPGFARGGRVAGTGDGLGDLLSKARRKATDVISGLSKAFTDPAGLIKSLAAKLTGLMPGKDSTAGRIVAAVPTKIAAFVADKFAGMFAGGAEGGPVPPLGAALGWQRQMSILRSVFPGLSLNSGFRPGSITATGNLSYHARGRAVDVPPRMDVFNWIRSHFPDSRELIFSPAGGRQIWNGRPHVYSEPTRSDHFDHVHWAYDQGGYIPPGISTVYNGTGKPEPVLTDGQWQAMIAGRGQGGETHTHYEIRDDQATLARVQARQDRDLVLARAERGW